MMIATPRKVTARTRELALALALLAALLAPALAQARPGDLDRSFGEDGKVKMGFCGGYASPYAVVTDSRARIVVGGQNTWSDGLCVDRYRSDGTLDPSFGSGGEVKTDLGAAEFGQRIVQGGVERRAEPLGQPLHLMCYVFPADRLGDTC